MHGWRETMEDAHIIVLSMENHPNSAFFGIFDGHSGSACSKFVSDNLPKNLDTKITEWTEADISNIVMETDKNSLIRKLFNTKTMVQLGSLLSRQWMKVVVNIL